MKRVQKKIYLSHTAAEIIDPYLKQRVEEELTTQGRIIEDALLLYISNDPLADESVKEVARNIYNNRNRAINYTSLEEAGKQAL